MYKVVINVSFKCVLIINVYLWLKKWFFPPTGTLWASKQLWKIVFNPSQMTQKCHWGFSTHYLANPSFFKPGDVENHSNQGQDWGDGQCLKDMLAGTSAFWKLTSPSSQPPFAHEQFKRLQPKPQCNNFSQCDLVFISSSDGMGWDGMRWGEVGWDVVR